MARTLRELASPCHRNGSRPGALGCPKAATGPESARDDRGRYQWQRLNLRHVGGYLLAGGLQNRGLHVTPFGAL